MRFSTGVFILDGLLAATLVAVGPWLFALLVGFVVGAAVTWLFKEKVARDAYDLYNRYRKVESADRVRIESILRDAEERIWKRK